MWPCAARPREHLGVLCQKKSPPGPSPGVGQGHVPLRRPPGEQEAGRSATAGLWSGTSARPHLPRRGLGGGEGMALKALVVASGTWVFDLRST